MYIILAYRKSRLALAEGSFGTPDLHKLFIQEFVHTVVIHRFGIRGFHHLRINADREQSVSGAPRSDTLSWPWCT